MKKSNASYCVTTAIALLILVFAVPHQAQKITTEEIIRRHVEAIGSTEARKGIKNRLAVGMSKFASKMPDRSTTGKAVLVTQDKDIYFLASFNSREFPFEKIGFFKDSISLPFVTAGARSPLGSFIADHPALLREGIFLGSISNSWGLLEGEVTDSKFGKPGKKSVDGRQAYVITYFLKGVSPQFSVRLFFDAETFHHLRTEYLHTVPVTEMKAGILGVQGGAKISMTERFSNFQTHEGLTLPHAYNIDYRTDSNSGTYEYKWTVDISAYHFNRDLDAGFFSFDEKESDQ